MSMFKVRNIAGHTLRAASSLLSDVRLSTPGFAHAEPDDAERELAVFIRERGYKALTPEQVAAFAFRFACAVLKAEKLEDGFAIEIDDNAVLPQARETTKGKAA